MVNTLSMVRAKAPVTRFSTFLVTMGRFLFMFSSVSASVIASRAFIEFHRELQNPGTLFSNYLTSDSRQNIFVFTFCAAAGGYHC